MKPHVVWCTTRCFDYPPGEVEVCLRGGWEGYFDFFIAKFDKHLEVSEFLIAVLRIYISTLPVHKIEHQSSTVFNCKISYHRVDQRLVSISEICSQPTRSFVDGLRGPLPIWYVQGLEPSIFPRRILKPAILHSASTQQLQCRYH